MNLFKPLRIVRCPKLPASYTGYNLTVYIRFSRKVRYTGTERIVNSFLRMKIFAEDILGSDGLAFLLV